MTTEESQFRANKVIFRVSAESDHRLVAGAVAETLREQRRTNDKRVLALTCVGGKTLSIASKAVCDLNRTFSNEGLQAWVLFRMFTSDEDGMTVTAMIIDLKQIPGG